jgi:L-methionine (R)-S-oxide reductase
MMKPAFSAIVKELASSDAAGRTLRRLAMERISRLEGYDSSYIYRLEGDELVLDEFVGEPTEHERIPVGRGVCGTAVSEGRNQVVADVSALDNYLACSLKTKSEIVVLIRQAGEILGQIDIDGHTAGTFTAEDEEFLEQVALLLADRWEQPAGGE